MRVEGRDSGSDQLHRFAERRFSPTRLSRFEIRTSGLSDNILSKKRKPKVRYSRRSRPGRVAGGKGRSAKQ